MKPLNLRANGGKTPKTTPGQQCPGKCLHAHMQHFFSPSPAIEKKFAESAFFHIKIKNLSWNRWIYEPNGAKHQKLLLGNNAPGKCLHAHMQHFFSPSPAIEKQFAESAFFHKKIKNLSWNRWIYEPMGAKHQKLLLGNNAPGKCLHAHMQHFFSPSPAIEKKFAESAFFHTKIKNLSWNRWIYEPMGAKHQKLLLGNNAPGKCLHAHMQHFFSPSPAIEKKFAESAFFHTKIKNLSWNRRIYEPNGAKHQKLLLGNNAPGKCLHAHMQHFFSPSPAIEKKFAESAFFHTKIKNLSWNRWIYEPMGAKHQKLLLGNNAPGKCLHGHMQHFFSPSPAIEKKFAESAFFHTKIKNLSWNRWIYEPMGAKHQKLLLGNNAPGKCLHAHMQHFFSPSPAIEKQFAESSYFHIKIKTCHETVEFTSQWGQNTKNYSWATMSLASAFTPTCNISSALAPLSRKNSLSQHFFIQKSKTCHETVEFTSQWGQTPKTTPGQQCHWQVPSRPHATFLQPRYREKIPSAYQKLEKKFTSQWGQNTKNYSWATMSLHACNIFQP